MDKNLKLFLHLDLAALPEFRAPFCGNLQREVICREAAEVCCSAEQVQAELCSAAELPLESLIHQPACTRR